MVELLIGQGADLSLKNNDGNTVLHLLAIQCDTDPDNTIKYLQVNAHYITSKCGPQFIFPPVNHILDLSKLLCILILGFCKLWGNNMAHLWDLISSWLSMYLLHSKDIF